MTARRIPVVAALTVLACVLPMGTAQAAGAGQVTSPSSGATITSTTAIQVAVTGDTQPTNLFEPPPPHQVQVRLATPSGAEILPGTSPVTMSCESNCHSSSTWTAPAFDPATLAPFDSGPSCNGGYTIQVRVDGGAWSGHGIRVARAPGAPTDVTVTADIGEATVSWGPASDPDVVGYRVQRRPSGGSWTTVADQPASARSLHDPDVDAGDVDYRVATLKGDGRVDGAPAAPCQDTSPDLSTASVPVSTTVREPAAAPSGPSRPAPTSTSEPDDEGSGSGSGDGDGSGDGSDDGPGDGSGDGTGQVAGSGDGNGETESEGGDAAAASRRPGTRVAPPAAVDAGARPDVTVDDVPGADSPQVADEDRRETYYGDDQEFSEELDFDGLGGVEATGPTTVTETRVVRVPGALQSILGEELDLGRLATPIAAGLIMVALALHLRRWMRDTVES